MKFGLLSVFCLAATLGCRQSVQETSHGDSSPQTLYKKYIRMIDNREFGDAVALMDRPSQQYVAGMLIELLTVESMDDSTHDHENAKQVMDFFSEHRVTLPQRTSLLGDTDNVSNSELLRETGELAGASPRFNQEAFNLLGDEGQSFVLAYFGGELIELDVGEDTARAKRRTLIEGQAIDQPVRFAKRKRRWVLQMPLDEIDRAVEDASKLKTRSS